MSYDHAKKVGNKGDVWKHFILLTLLRQLTEERRSLSDRFRYFESHAGRGLYTLKEKGEWRQGIGRVTESPNLPREHPYFQILGTSITSGSNYLGSWLLVGKYLSNQRVPFRLLLCDTSQDVADAIRTEMLDKEVRSAISFHQSDGFAKLGGHAGQDLVLVDPGYHPNAERDWAKCRQAAMHLEHTGTPFVIWYPVFWPTKPTKLVRETGLPGFEVLWAPMGQKPSQNQKGCGILAGTRSEKILRAVTAELSALAVLLSGELIIREP
jgi:23S rRNA (adenine2030-N6)-methyltransferase